MSANVKTDFCKQAISRCSVWGKFRFREADDWRSLKLRLARHAASDFHRVSAHVFKSSRFLLQHLPQATENLKAHSTSAHKASSKLEFIGRLDAVAAASTAQASGQPAAPSEAAASTAQASGQPAALSEAGPPAASSEAGQPAAPSAPGQPAKPRESGESAVAKQTTLQSSACTLDLAIGSIQDPLRGNVPQREDWVEVWAASSSAISFRKQEAVKEKRGQPQIERRRKREIVAIEAEVVRESCRKRLRVATSVSVAFDECDTRKVIRVRCDTQEKPYQWDGVIGIVRKQYGVTSDTSAELKDDHAVHNLRLLEETLRAC